MKVRSLYLLRASESNYVLQFASLYRLTSGRDYSTKAANSGTNASSSTNTGKRSSFANRLRANREVDHVVMNQIQSQQKHIPSPSPSSMRRIWEKSEERLPLNFIDFRDMENPYMRGTYQNVLVSKLPISATYQDIVMLTKGIFPDNEKFINKIFIAYNNHYKPTGSAWIQFNHSKNALLFTKFTDQKTFYGNKLKVELKKHIPEKIQSDPLNFHAGKCIILAGLPTDVDESFMVEYIRQIFRDKIFSVVNVTPRTATSSDTSKWLILVNNVTDAYYIFSKIHNGYFDMGHQMKARIVK